MRALLWMLITALLCAGACDAANESSSSSSASSLPVPYTETYSKIAGCLLHNKNLSHFSVSSFRYPQDAEAHYKELLQKTAKYRKHNMHSVSSYRGPWIENVWISEFMGKPLSYFNGMIPLFVQWVDIHAHIFLGRENRPLYSTLYEELHSEFYQYLREDVIYVTVSQDDEGIDRSGHTGLFTKRPNILTLSAGGYGHIPLPLIKGVVDYIPPPANGVFTWQIGFYGTHDTSQTRARLLDAMRGEVQNTKLTYHHASSPNWQQLMASTLLNLCPRGYGRSSYRLAEVIQLGRIPVYLFNDVPWLPYAGSNVSLENIGFSADFHGMQKLTEKLESLTTTEIKTKLERVKQAREYYTLQGVVRQIDLFFHDPLGPNGGYLRCTAVPPAVL